MNAELLRIADNIAREKSIEREAVYLDIEQAIASGLRRQYQTEDASEFEVQLDRTSGAITIFRQGQPLPLSEMGRIGAQTVKQVMIQLLRQDERGSIYDEFKDRVGTILTGTVARFEGPTMIVNLGRVEGIMPRSEQIPGEFHNEGERIQALVVEVRDTPSQVKIILSRSHPELIRRLFEREVPEVGERTIEIKALAREAGARTKLAVSSIDAKVDAVGACVGVRGSRIKNIVEELGGEKIDIVRWNESSQILIANALKPAEVAEVSLCFELGRATVVVNEDQLSLAIGKRGQNVRLAARLTGWDVDILTPQEFQENVDRLETTLKQVEGVDQDMVDKVIALGLIDVRDIEEVGEQPLMDEIGVSEELAERMVDVCTEEAKIVMKEQEAKKKREAAAKDAARSALLGGPVEPAPQLTGGVGAQGGPSTGANEPFGGFPPPAGDTPESDPDQAGAARESDASLRETEGGQAGNTGPEAKTNLDATPQGELHHVEDTDDTDVLDETMHGPFENVPGGSAEVITHDESAVGTDGADLSPEERAIHIPGAPEDGDPQTKKFADQESEEAALAEGRIPPPTPNAPVRRTEPGMIPEKLPDNPS